MHSGNRGNIFAANLLLLIFTSPVLFSGRVYSAEEETSYGRMPEYSEIIERFDAIEKEIANIPAPQRPELFNEFSGSNFEIDLDTNTKVGLRSTEYVTIQLPPEPIGRIEFLLFSTSTRPTTTFTFENLTPGKEYSYYENGYLSKKFTAEQNGRISIEQNISESAQISLRSSAHTIYIRSTGEVEPPNASIIREYLTESYYITADITDTIVIQRNGITIDGNGYTIYPPANEPAFNLQGIWWAQLPLRKIRIKNVNIVGGSYYAGAVYLQLTDNITLENVDIRDVRVGLMASRSNQLKVMGCGITNAEYGITLRACSSPEIRGNHIDSIANTGIYLYGGNSGSNITGNTITNISAGPYSNGIYIYNYAHQIATGINHSIEGNQFDNCFYSVVLENTNKSRITNNLMGVGQVGIYLKESDNNIISHSTKETAGIAIVLQGGNEYNEISTNTFSHSGIMLWGYGWPISIYNANNRIFNNEIQEIYSRGCINTIFGHNKFTQGSGDFFLTDCNNSSIVENVMLSGRYYIRQTTNCTFSGNVLSGGGAIHVVDNSCGNIFEENTLNNGCWSMGIGETCDNNTIRANTFEKGISHPVECRGEGNEFYRNNFINNEKSQYGSKENTYSKELPIGGNYWEGIDWENPKINWELLEGEPSSERLKEFRSHVYAIGGFGSLGFFGYYKYLYYYYNYHVQGKVFAVEDFLKITIPTIEGDGEIFYDCSAETGLRHPYTGGPYMMPPYDYYRRIEPWKIKTVSPSAVSITAVSDSHNSAVLKWTAPDDIWGGKYHLRYSPVLVGGEIASTEIEWYMNTVSGKQEEKTIDGLESGTTYYFQLRTRDEVPDNWSDWSPMVSEKTWYYVESDDGALGINFRELPPGATDVWINQVEMANAEYEMDAANAHDLMLCGNYLYQVEPDSVFDTPAKGEMYYLDPAEDLGLEIDEHSLTVFKFVDTVWQAAAKTSQDIQQNRIEFDCDSTGLFAVFASKPESGPPVTVIGFDGQQYLQYISTATKIYFTAYDLGADGVPASGVSFTEYRIDGSEWLTYVSSFTLTEGGRAIDYRSRDKLGTYEDIKSTSVYVDGTAPKTTLEFGDGKFEDAGYTYVESGTTLSLWAEDIAIYGLASGTKTTVYRIDEGPWEQYAGSFTMQDKGIDRGRHKIKFHSIDNVGNTEEIKTEFVIVPWIHPINIGWPDFPTSMNNLIKSSEPWDIIEAYGQSGDWANYPLVPIEINKPLNIRGLEGAEIRVPKCDGLNFIEITSDNVVFSSFTINYGYDIEDDIGAENTKDENLIGIKIHNANNVVIKNNTIMRVSTGIYCSNGNNILIKDNILNAYWKLRRFYSDQYGNGSTGIYLDEAQGVLLSGNEIVAYDNYGLKIKGGNDTRLWNNTVKYNRVGINADPVNDIELTSNLVIGNSIGIQIIDMHASIENNLIERNSTGIYLSNSSPDVRTNTIRFNETGIFTENHSAPAVRENNIYGNSRFGVKNADVSISVNARYNWWQKDFPIQGDTAPADVSSGVDYANWSVIMFGKGFPVAVAGEDINVNAGDMAHFSGSESYDLDGVVCKYFWDFGDGNTFEGKFASHIYQDTGTFLVSLVVEDNEGLKGFDNLKCKVELPDTTPPVTTLNISGDCIVLSDTQTYVSSLSSFSLTAYDPLFMGRASGLDYTEFKIDSGEWILYSGTFTLSGYAGDISGEHTIEYRSIDKAGNVETAKYRSVYYDVSPPVINILFPAAGEVYLPGGLLEIDFSATDNSDPEPAVAAYLFNAEKSSTIAVVRGQTIEPLDIGAGLWTLTVEATDWLGHSASTTTGAFEVIHDILPPRTDIALTPPKYITETSTFVAGETQFSLSAVDDMVEVGDGIGMGVEETRYSINQEAVTVYMSSFTLFEEGENTIRYYSLDVVGNVEEEKTLSVIADFSAPETAVSVSAPLWENYITSRSSITLSAEDKGIIPSGVRETKYSISQSPFVSYDSPFVISGADGIYYLNYYSDDNVLNTEGIKSLTVKVDNTAPETQLLTRGERFESAGKTYIRPDTEIILTAEDPVINEVASGVKEIKWKVNGGEWKVYAGTFALTEGIRAVEYYAYDNLGNTEQIKSQTFYVDGTVPETALNIGMPEYEAEGKIYISAETEITLSAADPVVEDVSSGVHYTEYRIDGAGWQNYTGRFALTGGIRVVEYRTVDNVGNIEEIKAITLFVDATAPATAIEISGPKFSGEDGVYVTSGTVFMLTAEDPVVNEVASGVKETKYRVLGSTGVYEDWKTYWPLKITGPDGVYTIEFYSADNVENTEGIKSLTVKVDNTAPETELLTRGERFESAGKTYIRPDTEIILTAEDPLINDVAVGVEDIIYRIDGGDWKVYTGTFTLSEGIRAVEYYAYDNLGNTEEIKLQTFYVDGTAPVSAISAGEPRFEAFGLTIIDPATPIGLTANDPEVNAVASGVRRIEYRIDPSTVTETQWEVYTGTFTLLAGSRVVEYRSLDNVSNTEAVKKAAYTVTYISRYAAYGEEGVKVGGQGEIIGDVRSNGEVKVAGQARIEGSAIGETVEVDGTEAKITGQITENTETINPWGIDLEAVEQTVSQENDNDKLELKDGQLRISSNRTVTITSGTYYLSGINVTAKAKLNIEENVNIFCTGKVTVAAKAEVNYAGGDYGLVIFCRSDENINISGGGDMRGIIYAPESFAHISGQGLTVGNVFAKRVDVTGQGIIVGTGREKTGGRSIMSAGRTTAPSNLAMFELRESYVYPNPAKRVNPKIHFNCGVSGASVNLRIFTVAGEQVLGCDISGSYDPSKNAYEYEWDTTGKASGVYIYLIRADRNGATLKKTGKMAVIK